MSATPSTKNRYGEYRRPFHQRPGRRRQQSSRARSRTRRPVKSRVTSRWHRKQRSRRRLPPQKRRSPEWRNTPPLKRARVMFRFKQLLEEHADEVVAAITNEHGKVLDDAMGEFIRGVEVVEYACGIPEMLKGEYSQERRPEDRQLVGAPAARCRRRHHAIQFPGHGADVDVPDGDRLRQYVRSQTVGERPDSPDARAHAF